MKANFLRFPALFGLILSGVLNLAAVEAPLSATWLKQLGGAQADQTKAVTTDAAGNVYITGSFSGTATLDGVTLNARGNTDIFVAKYASDGTQLWLHQAGGHAVDEGAGIAVDKDGNVYVTGYFSDTGSFGAINISSLGNENGFIAKYDAVGNVLWAVRTAGSSVSRSQAIAVDASGNAFITGYYESTASFGSITVTNAGFSDLFVAKYNPAGEVQWAKGAGTPADDQGQGITVDFNGDVYVAGYFGGEINFGLIKLIATGETDAFLAKYNTAGTALWVQKCGGSKFDYGRAVAADKAGGVYLTGSFEATATFGSTSLSSRGLNDDFLVKYNSAGQMQWVRQAGGSSNDTATDVVVDSAGSVYLTGLFAMNTTFSSALAGAGSFDAFVAKFDAQGNYIWANPLGGMGLDMANRMAIDGEGNIYLAASFDQTSSYLGFDLASAGSSDAVLVKMSIVVPSLSVELNGDIVLVSWATNVFGFKLESTPAVSAIAKWQPVAQTPFVLGGRRVAAFDLSEPKQFFRLHR